MGYKGVTGKSIDLLRRLMTQSPANDECVLWPRHLNRQNGYGRLNYRKKRWQAHRLAYILSFGAVPAGLYVLHSCDVPRCVRLSHLKTGTHSDNMQDKIRKGRANIPRGPRPHLRILTDDQIGELRRLRAEGWTFQSIADKFGISLTLAYHRSR